MKHFLLSAALCLTGTIYCAQHQITNSSTQTEGPEYPKCCVCFGENNLFLTQCSHAICTTCWPQLELRNNITNCPECRTKTNHTTYPVTFEGLLEFHRKKIALTRQKAQRALAAQNEELTKQYEEKLAEQLIEIERQVTALTIELTEKHKTEIEELKESARIVIIREKGSYEAMLDMMKLKCNITVSELRKKIADTEQEKKLLESQIEQLRYQKELTEIEKCIARFYELNFYEKNFTYFFIKKAYENGLLSKESHEWTCTFEKYKQFKKQFLEPCRKKTHAHVATLIKTGNIPELHKLLSINPQIQSIITAISTT